MTTSKHKNWTLANVPTTPPVDIFLGFTADDTMPFCRATQFVTDGPWGHVFVGFRFIDGSACYFEALISDGVSGPWPLERVVAWSEEDPKHRLAIVDIPRSWIPGGDLLPALDRAWSAVGKQSYWKPQLLAMLFFERYGRALIRDENKTVCSEFSAWVCEGIIDLRDRRRQVIDAVNPNSAWHRLSEELSGLGQYTQPIIPKTDTKESVPVVHAQMVPLGVGASL